MRNRQKVLYNFTSVIICIKYTQDIFNHIMLKIIYTLA